jgi:hypothetical protein
MRASQTKAKIISSWLRGNINIGKAEEHSSRDIIKYPTKNKQSDRIKPALFQLWQRSKDGLKNNDDAFESGAS